MSGCTPVSNVGVHEDFIHLFSSLGLSSLVNEPTHRDGNILDLILTNTSSAFSKVSIEEGGLVRSDHCALKFEISIKKSRPKYKKVKKFCYRKADWDFLNLD